MDLVSGGTGRIGRHVVHGLLRQKAAVRALVRDAGRARAVLGPDVELVEGDLDDPSSLARAAAGARSVLILSGHHPRQAEQQGNLLRAAQAAGAERIVKVSGINATIRPEAASPVSQAHWRTEQDIRAAGVPWTVVRPSFFMDNTLDMVAPSVDRTGKVLLPLGKAPVAMVDVRDVAAVVVAALTGGTEHHGVIHVVTGPHALTWYAVADLLAAHLDRRVRYRPLPPALAALIQRRRGVPQWLVAHQTALARAIASGAAQEVTDVVTTVTGQPPRPFPAFLNDHAEAFQPKASTTAASGSDEPA
jgi:uncharacterized protein YbjT (DUF2867 family)